MEQKVYFLKLKSENALRVLQRISTVFSRNRFNIEELHVKETEDKGISIFSVTIHAEPHRVENLKKQLRRIIEVIEVSITAK